MSLLEPGECAAIRSLIQEKALSFLRERHPEAAESELVRRHLWQESPELIQFKQWLFRNCHDAIGIPRIIQRLSARMGLDPSDVFVANLFFLRFCFPGQTSNGIEPIRSRVSSPLHYDRYGCDQTTVWVPLVDTTPETGTFMWTEHPELMRWRGSNLPIAHPKDFHAAPNGFDALMARFPEGVREEFCRAGECLLFNKDLLHGSTQARSEARITFDFRIVDSSAVRSLQESGRLTAPPEPIASRA